MTQDEMDAIARDEMIVFLQRMIEESIMPNGDASIEAGQQGQTQAIPTIVGNTIYFGVSADGAYGYYTDELGTIPIHVDNIPVGVELRSVVPQQIRPVTPHVPIRPIEGEHAEPDTIDEDTEPNEEDEDESMPETETVDDSNPYEMVVAEGDSTSRQKKIDTIAMRLINTMKGQHKDSRWYAREMEIIKRRRQDLQYREDEFKKRQLAEIIQSKKITAIKKGMASIAQSASGRLRSRGIVRWH